MVTYVLQCSLSSYKLKATRVIFEEEMNSDCGVKTLLCLMLVELKRENKIKDCTISYLVCLGGLELLRKRRRKYSRTLINGTL